MKTIRIGLIGNVLEWYDFTIYGYMAPVIAKLFFPAQDSNTALMWAFCVFAVGFVMRPLGACFFGSLGDRLGRKPALLLSAILITLPTFLMGLLPTYAHIGIAAPVLLVVLRLLQGLSVGGEHTSAILFMTEHAPEGKRYFAGSFALVGSGIGWLLGSGVASLVTVLCGEQTLMQWGWRVPFFLSALTGVWAVAVRAKAQETGAFQAVQQEEAVAEKPLSEVVSHQKTGILTVMGLNGMPAIAGYVLFAYMPSYLAKVAHVPLATALSMNTVALVFNVSLMPAAGWLADRLGAKVVLGAGAAGMALFAIPLFHWMSDGSSAAIMASWALLTVFVSLYHPPLPAHMAEIFPTRLRASGVALAYNMAVSVFSGTCPMVCSYLVGVSGSTLFPAYYLVFVSLVSFGVVLATQKKKQQVSQGAA